jgi:hypothetical protein
LPFSFSFFSFSFSLSLKAQNQSSASKDHLLELYFFYSENTMWFFLRFWQLFFFLATKPTSKRNFLKGVCDLLGARRQTLEATGLEFLLRF